MGDVPGLPPTKSVTFINQAVVPDTLPGEGTLYSNSAGDLSYKSSTGTVTDLISGSGGGGTVTSVGLSLPVSVFTVTGSPVTTTGVLTGTLNTQAANTVWAGPPSGAAGAPSFRILVANDVPSSTTLAGDVTGTLGATTVALVGGVSAANVATAATAVNAGSTAGYVLQASGTAGGESYQPYPAATQRVISNSTTPGTSLSPTLAASGTLYINQGINTNLNVNLPVPGASPLVSYSFLNEANQTSSYVYTITIPNTVSVYYPGSSVPLSNTTITTYIAQAFMQITSTSSGTYAITALGGQWTTASGINLVGSVTNASPVSGHVLTDNGVGVAPTFQAATGGSGITALTGDVSASGSGSVAATVNSVGGATAANVATAASLATTSLPANEFLASPNGSSGAPTGRAMVQADLPANAVTTTASSVTQYAIPFFPTAASAAIVGTSFTFASGGNRMIANSLGSVGAVPYGLNAANTGMYSSAAAHVSLAAGSTLVFDSSSTLSIHEVATQFSISAAFAGQASAPTGTSGFGTLYSLTSDGNLYYINATGNPALLNGLGATTAINNQAGAGGTYPLVPGDRGKIVTDAGTTVQQTYSLPSAPALGDTYYIVSTTATGGSTPMKINSLNASHVIQLPVGNSMAGTAHGIIANQNARTNGANIQLCYVATNTWRWIGGYPYDWTTY